MEGQGGPRTGPEIRDGRENYFLGGFGRKRPCSKASWAPYNPFPFCRIPCNPMGDHFFHKTIFFQVPFSGKKGPRPSWGPNLKSGVPKIVPRVENTKVACRKTIQNPVVGIPNGAICCKLGPKTILGPPPRKTTIGARQVDFLL